MFYHVILHNVTNADSGLPLLNSSTFQPVVSLQSEVMPFLLQQQRCESNLPSNVTLASSLSVFKNLFLHCYKTV